MRVRWLLVGALGLVASLSSCGGDGADPDSGPVAVDAGPVDEDDAGPLPVDAGPVALADAGSVTADDAGPAASVQWLVEVEPQTVDGDIAVDFFYQYEVAIAGNPLSYELFLERCVTIAGMEEQCSTEPRDSPPSSGGVRWGLDPGQYAVGENRYRFHLMLMRGSDVVSEDEVELVFTVTSCTTCVGA